MARRIHETNGNGPPPSTLAAQLVHNRTEAAPTQSGGGKIPLKALLHEILSNPGAAEETNIDVNVQLVLIICELGLGPLTQSSPFHDAVGFLDEARDSIAVIEKTVRRQPEVLLTPISEGGPQLALVLFARLAAVCGRESTAQLPIESLFRTCVEATTTSVLTWAGGAILQAVLMDIVDGTYIRTR